MRRIVAIGILVFVVLAGIAFLVLRDDGSSSSSRSAPSAPAGGGLKDFRVP
ncbi:MAG: hypothetical protein Q7R91_00270 [bacterium]|nr:hypothetical protein [bacterium]